MLPRTSAGIVPAHDIQTPLLIISAVDRTRMCRSGVVCGDGAVARDIELVPACHLDRERSSQQTKPTTRRDAARTGSR